MVAESERPAAARALQAVLDNGEILRAQNRRIGPSATPERIVDLSMRIIDEAAPGACVLVQAVDVTHRRRPQPDRGSLAFAT